MERRLKPVSLNILRWTERAFKNLETIVVYVAEDSPKAATDLAAKIHTSVQGLKAHPQIGRLGRCRGTHELIVVGTPFIVAYRIKGEHVEILAVLHGAQKWPRSF
jgi:toxin ParE1/3/4